MMRPLSFAQEQALIALHETPDVPIGARAVAGLTLRGLLRRATLSPAGVVLTADGERLAKRLLGQRAIRATIARLRTQADLWQRETIG